MNGLNNLISALRNLVRRFAAGATVLKKHPLWFVSIDLWVRKTLIFAMVTFSPNGCVLYLISEICKFIGFNFPLRRAAPGSFHGGVSCPGWPAEDSHPPWTDFWGQRHRLPLGSVAP